MRKLVLTALAVACAVPAHAGVVYSNDFNSENGGNTALNYNGFNGLTVTDGTVDLVKSGDFGINCAGGSGACVDLDGSTSNSGLVSSNSYAFNAGDHVALSFLFSGNQRDTPPPDSFNVKFMFTGTASGTWGFTSDSLGSASFGPFTASTSLTLGVVGISPGFAMSGLTLFFDPTTSGSTAFSFEDQGNDNVGIIVDNLSLSVDAVPEPATWAMMIAGFGFIGAAARQRRLAFA